MKLPRAISLAALLCLGLVSATHADQLAWVEQEVAKRAAAQLRPGTLIVDWVSHMPDSTPRLLRVVSVKVQPTGYEDLHELVAECLLVATSRKGSQQGAAHDFQLEDRRPLQESLDLAYVYVPSQELPGMFVCLGKLLEQPCEVESVALEVPGQVLAAVEPPRASGIVGSLDEDPSGDTVWRIGTIVRRGDQLGLKNTRRTLRLTSFAASQVERALGERVGARVSLRGTLSADGKSLSDVEVIRYHSR